MISSGHISKSSESDNTAVSNSLFFQPKLTINQPNDIYEQEADAMADKVMRMTGNKKKQELFFRAATNSINRKCDHCEEEKMQRKEINGEEVNSDNDLESYVNNLNNNGQSLPDGIRNFYESGFGYDFSKIKVHTDGVAAKSAQSINARAYTSGNNIIFNSNQYAPDRESGKRLIAHELTHTIQNGGTNGLLQRACGLDFTRYTGDTCRGTIQVGATTISSPIVGYYHLFIVYTDSSGARFYLRGGPGNTGGGYGNIVVLCAPYAEGEREYDSRNILEEVYQGPDACNKLTAMRQRLNEIESWNVAYVPAGPNSNSVIATLLRVAGLPLSKPVVPAPGFEMEVTRTGTNPLAQDRPTRFLVSLGGGSGLLLNAEVQQRLYTFSPVVGNGIPLPIPLELNAGLYAFPDQGRIGGAVGLGTNISLINLPLSVFSPLGIVLGGGFTAGSARTTDDTGATRRDPEIGGYARTGVYTDIGRVRISPLYQYNRLYNTGTGASTSEHSFVVQLGGTF